MLKNVIFFGMHLWRNMEKYVPSKHRSETLIQEQSVGKDISKKKLQSGSTPHSNKTADVWAFAKLK